MHKVNYKKLFYLLIPVVFLTVSFFAQNALAGSIKKVVAVSRFENRSGWAGGGQYILGDGMADQLTDALIQSKKFVVLERQTLSDVMGEQDLAASGRAQKSRSAKTGKLVSAQILIKGTITEFQIKSSGSSTGIGYKGFSIGGKRSVAHVGLILRLINTTSGEVLASERVEGSAKAGGLGVGGEIAGVDFGTEGFHRTPLGKAVQISIDNAVEIITSKMKGIPYQGSVIKVKGDVAYISCGERNGASKGDSFTVYSKGEELIDPDTGQTLGVEEEKIGLVKITSVKEKFSKAAIVNGEGIKRGDVIRPE